MDDACPDPWGWKNRTSFLEFLEVLFERFGEDPRLGVPYEVVEYRPYLRAMLLGEVRHPFAALDARDSVEVEGFGDVLGDVVDRVGVSLHVHAVVGEPVYVDESDLPQRALGVPVVEVFELPEDGGGVGVGRVRAVGSALAVPSDFHWPVQVEQHVDGRVAGRCGLFDDDLGVPAVDALLESCEETGYALSFGCDVAVGLVAGHGLMVDGEGHEEQAGENPGRRFERDCVLLQKLG